MNQDYFINDDNQNNWVTLAEPLSSYTQERLAEQLINNKKETNRDQSVIIDGMIGATLSTAGIETKEEFLTKYASVLDRAGFKKEGEVMVEEAKEEVKPLTIKPKALSRVSLMDYTQEELAHLIMDDKINNNDGTEYGIYEHRDTIFDSTGCNTIEDFINKYQEEFAKRRIKSENPQVAAPVVEEKTEEPTNITKDGIRVITVPLGMVNYSIEQLAHLVMDNKVVGEEVGVKVNNGVVLDSTGCNTVEEFIAKNEKVAMGLGINHDYSEKVEAVGSITDMPQEINTFKLDEAKIEQAREEVKVEEVKEETPVTLETVQPMGIIPLLQDMLAGKSKTGKDVNTTFRDFQITTEGCNDMASLMTKYNNIIEAERKETYQEVFKNREVEKAVELFKIPRGNYYNENENIDEAQLAVIRDKNIEYVKLIKEKENVDFSNPEVVYTWLNKLVPFINTHALNLNLGMNVSVESADKYLLKVMAENGYTADLNDPTNMDSFEKYRITEKLSELEKYHFFASDYAKLPEEDRKLTSPKTDAMAEINYLNSKVDRGVKGLSLINADLVRIRTNTKMEISRLERRVAELSEEIPENANVDLATLATTEEEKAAYQAYLQVKTSQEIGEVQNVMTMINALPEDSKAKAELEAAAYRLFNTKEYNQQLDELNNKPINEKEECLTRIEELKANQKSIEERYAQKQKSIIEAMTFVNTRISSLRVQYNLMSYGREEEIKEEVHEEPVAGPKEEVVSTIEAPAVVETNYDLSLDDSQYDLSVPDEKDSINEFVPIKSFKKITKDLYDRINHSKVKEVIKKAIDKLKENKKAALVYAGFAATVVLTAVAASKNISTEEESIFEPIAMEQTIDNQEALKETENTVEKSMANNESINESVTTVSEEPEYEVSLDEAAQNSINEAMDGKTTVYTSFEDATNQTNGVEAADLYQPSWETATPGEFYVEQDGNMEKLSKDEAIDYYQNGQNIVQSVENDGTVIGYVNVDNNNAGKSM